MSFTPKPIDNPFAPPEARLATGAIVDSSDFFTLFVRWEKYRLIYNGILFLESLFGLALTMSFHILLTRTSSLVMLVLVANVCFCVGMILNGYAWWLGLRSRWIGRIIFSAGTLLAMMLVVAALIYLVHPSAFSAD